MPEPTKLGVLLAQFSAGGAERQTYELLTRLDPAEFHVTCFVLSETIEPYGTALAERGVRVVTMTRRRSYDFGRVLRLRRLLRESGCELLHGIGYEPSAYGYFATLGLARPRLVPSIRSAVLYPKWPKPLVYRCMFRKAPRAIANSERGARFALEHFGALAPRLEVIPNGLPFTDIERASEGGDLRAELGLPAGTPLVGFVGKDSWQKNVRRFLEVAGRVAASDPAAHFVLVGWKLGDADRARLGISDPRIHTLGVRRDVYRLIRAFDVLVMTSETEGCPNVVLEAGGLGVPVVAPDVGDVESILGPAGAIGLVRGQDPAAYAERIVGALRRAGGWPDAAREVARRVRATYDVDAMVRKTCALYRAALHGNAGPRIPI